MMNEEIEVGQRIRERRQLLGISLRELAGKTELSAAFLSQVERGQANTSISSLRRIAAALDTSLLYFLADAEAQSTPQHIPVVRAGRRPKFSSPDSVIEYELLTPDLSRKMEVICGRVKPGSGNVVRHLREPTEEWIYVLSGALLVRLQQENAPYSLEEYVLGPGDSIYFEGSQLRALECASQTEDVVWISVFTPAVF
jgi:transcriptional regulator with XRE-family HTH domain